MTKEMDSRVELEPQLPEVFIGEGIRALGQEMARYSLTPLGEGRYLVRPESTDEEVADVLSRVKVADPNLRNLNPSENPVDSAALTLAKSYYLKEGIEDWKAKARVNKFADKVLEGSKKILSRPQLLKMATGMVIVGLLATACGSVSAAPQGRPLPPETPATAVPTPIESTKVPTPIPEVKVVSIPAELKNADKDKIAAWMAEGGTQLAILSRGDNLTGKLYFINGEGQLKDAPLPPLVNLTKKQIPSVADITMNKESGEIKATFSTFKGTEVAKKAVKLDQTSGDKWVDVKTGEFVWGNILGTVEPSNPAVKQLGTWNVNADPPRGKLFGNQPWQREGTVNLFRATITGLYKNEFLNLYELHYNFFNSDQKIQLFPAFKCTDCVVRVEGVNSKFGIVSGAGRVSLSELPPGTIISMEVNFPEKVSPNMIEARLKDWSSLPIFDANNGFFTYSLTDLEKDPW